MDIRSFFSKSPCNKDSKTKSKDNDLTKIKDSQSKKNVEPLISKSPDHKKDVNGNRTKENDNKRGKDRKRDKSRDKSDKSSKDGKTKHKEHKKEVRDEKRKRHDSDEVLIIDDDSLPENPVVKKTKSKNKGNHNQSHSDKNEDEDKTEKKRGKKRKKQISSEEEEDIKIDDDDEEEEFVVLKTSLKKKGKKKPRLLDSDEDEDPIPKKKSGKKRTIVHIGGTGDYEEVIEEKPKKTSLENFLTSSKPTTVKEQISKTKTETTKKKEVSAMDFFGTSTVHRVERKITHVKEPKKEPEKPASMDIDDIEMHSDDEFERTLELLDDDMLQTVKPNGNTSGKSNSGNKEKSPSKTPEKKPKVLVEDTPDTKMPHAKKAKMEFVMHRTDRNADKTPVKDKHSTSKTTKVSPTSQKSPGSDGKKQTSPKKPSPVKTDSESTPGQKGSGYRSYLNRAAPQALGSKEIPEGGENCLEGLTFVITGVLESFERDETKSMVEKYGGKVTGNVSKKTDYVVAGRDAGQSKMSKAESFKTKILDEDSLLDLIRTKPGKKSKYTLQAEESFKKEQSLSKQKSISEDSIKKETSFKSSCDIQSKSSILKTDQSEAGSSKSDQSVKSNKIQTDQSEPSLLWVDKYKPTQMKQIIGQTGDKSNAKKLLHWLQNWHKNQAAGVKPAPGRFFGRGGNDDGAGYKAALLSGPPGIGKTTTATIVCQEAGFSYVELNASDTRNAKSLKEVISQSVGNTSIVDYVGTGTSSSHGHKHCLIMDEVDGMSGNEDRGGVAELTNIIKNSKIPIITMCNDRNHQKMRTLSNYCFDLRFQRPRVEQIKAAVMSIAFKEGLKIPPPALNEIIVAANQDMRQVIHNLSMWTAADKAVSYDQIKADASRAKKDMKMGPFDVCRKVFVGGEETRNMTFNDKSDLFFHDYNISPLFVQENYIHVSPFAAKGSTSRHLSLLARSADSLCDSDLCEKKIRSQQSWSLLPLEAMYASVIPGEYMRGNISQMIAFPSWLGKNSTTSKTERILQELRTHMRLQISGDKKSLNLEYLPFFRSALTDPLVHYEGEGVRDVIKLMDEYDIIKDDFDNIMEITKWPNSTDPLSKLTTKTKSAFTRTYNKEVHKTPYSTGVNVKKRKGGGATTDETDLLGNEEEGAVQEEEEDDNDDLDLDTMIKKKTKASAKQTESKGKGKTTKGKAATQAKGKRK
ncbi:replication factor C subunit 1 [Mactra antiquata]